MKIVAMVAFDVGKKETDRQTRKMKRQSIWRGTESRQQCAVGFGRLLDRCTALKGKKKDGRRTIFSSSFFLYRAIKIERLDITKSKQVVLINQRREKGQLKDEAETLAFQAVGKQSAVVAEKKWYTLHFCLSSIKIKDRENDRTRQKRETNEKTSCRYRTDKNRVEGNDGARTSRKRTLDPIFSWTGEMWQKK